MKIFLMLLYLIVLLGLVKALNYLNEKFGNILACDKKVKAERRGYQKKEGSKTYILKVMYEYEGKKIITYLLDRCSLKVYGKHASSKYLDVYIDPKRPERAYLFRRKLVFKYGVLYSILVILSIVDIILISTSIF